MGNKRPIHRKISDGRIALVRRKSIDSAAEVTRCKKEFAKVNLDLKQPLLDDKTVTRLETKRVELEAQITKSQRETDGYRSRHLSYIRKNANLNGDQE